MQPMAKLFYSSGLISLILLPILCMQNIRCNPNLKQQHILEAIFPEPKEMPEILKKMPSDFEKIILKGDSNDVIKLNYAKAIVHESITTNTMGGFEFTFTPHAKYWSLVRLFDICKVENVPQYVCYQDKFWISLLKPSSLIVSGSIQHWVCGNVGLIMTPDQSEKDLFYEDVLDKLEVFWLPAILFATMIGLTVFKSHFLKLKSSKILNPPSKP